jgi:hypothetical protein
VRASTIDAARMLPASARSLTTRISFSVPSWPSSSSQAADLLRLPRGRPGPGGWLFWNLAMVRLKDLCSSFVLYKL